MTDLIEFLRGLGDIYEEAHDVIQYINLRHLEIERLQREVEAAHKIIDRLNKREAAHSKQIAAMTKDMDSLERQLEMANAAIERWKAENEELRSHLNGVIDENKQLCDRVEALKAQSTEPVDGLTKEYDAIDRFLRNNLDDDDYAEYSAYLDAVYAHP